MRRAATAAALALTALVLSAAPASAQVHLPEGVFCEPTGLEPAGSTCEPTFGRAQEMAVVPPGLAGAGDLLVTDAAAGTVSRFKPDGTPDPFSALGTNTIDGKRTGASNECPTVPADCDETPENGIVFGPQLETQIAVAPAGAAAGTAGDIYVTYRTFTPHLFLIDIFAPSGEYLGQLREYEEGPLAEGPLAPVDQPCGVAVNANGTVYVGDFGKGIHVYTPTSDPPSDADSSANFGEATTTIKPCGLALGSGPTAGALFAVGFNNKAVKLDAASGAYQYTLDAGSNATVAVNEANGHVYVAHNGQSGGVGKISEYDAAGAGGATVVSQIETGPPPLPAKGGIQGLAIAPGGEVYVAARTSGAEHFRLGVWSKALKQAPRIEDEAALAVGSHSATLAAKIGPEEAETHYYFEYGAAGPCSANPCAQTPARPPLEGNPPVAVQEEISGLQEATTYWWRAVATNACDPGEGTCGTSHGADHEVRTYSSAPFALPDERVWEMVSPPDKENGEVGCPNQACGESGTAIPRQASPDGEALSYSSFTSFDTEEGPAEGSATASQFLSRRGAEGWSTANLTPHFEEGFTADPIAGFSPDLRWAAAITYNPPLAPGAPANAWNLYRRDNLASSYEALTALEAAEKPECLGFAGASENFGRVFLFAREGKLLPGDPPAPVGSQKYNLYEWSAGGGLRLASVLPDGGAAEAQNSSAFGAALPSGSRCNTTRALLRHAVSADGERYFWTYGGNYSGGPKLAIGPLLAGLRGGAETVEVDAVQGGSSASAGQGKFWDASRDGRYVFFTDALKLTPGANTGDLYRYDVQAYEEGEPEPLADLTAGATQANVQGVVGASEKGDAVYFVARGALAAGATGSQNNLYAWVEGQGIRFLATLAPSADGTDWSANPKVQTARVSPDGTQVAFLSSEPLSGYDNTEGSAAACGEKTVAGERCAEAFVYDLGAEHLRCASCNPSGARPAGRANLPSWSTPYEQPRYLANSGRAFFESRDSLSPADRNGRRDVYQFEPAGIGSCTTAVPTYSPLNEGCADLISGGRGEDDSYLIDASESGNDVFFSTREPLVPQRDKDGVYDVYDARVGGSAPPPAPPPGCEGEACRGPASAAPAPASAGTAAFQGAGNPKAQRRSCPKGRRAVRRHGKTRCLKRHSRHRHRRKHRRAHRERRAGR